MAWIVDDLFRDKFSFVIFTSYILLFVNQGILITASKSSKNTYSYNTTTVILLTELFKCTAFVVLYLKNNSSTFFEDLKKNKRALILYFVPAGLYTVYNNLSYVNLSFYDPTTYFLLLQFKTVLTGIVYQILFSRRLSRVQWISLVLLTFGCILKGVHHTSIKQDSYSFASFKLFDIHLIFITVQIFTSVFACVYNEFLIKDTDTHFMIQNIFMYFDSIVCNSAVLLYQGELTSAFSITSLKTICQPIVIGIIINGTCIGICISFFLKILNSILKSFASAVELMFTAVLAWILFGIPVDMYTFAAIFVVTCAIVLYSQNPVVNLPKEDAKVLELRRNTGNLSPSDRNLENSINVV